MAAPFTVQGTLALPGVPGLPAEPLPFGVIGEYNSKSEFEYVFPSSPSGTQAVNFGTMPAAGAKLVLITYNYPGDVTEAVALASTPVEITLNASLTPIELSSGGVFMHVSPDPSAGITSASITYSSEGKVRVWLLG